MGEEVTENPYRVQQDTTDGSADLFRIDFGFELWYPLLCTCNYFDSNPHLLSVDESIFFIKNELESGTYKITIEK